MSFSRTRPEGCLTLLRDTPGYVSVFTLHIISREQGVAELMSDTGNEATAEQKSIKHYSVISADSLFDIKEHS